MPLTYSGRHVSLDNDVVPSLLDIAVGLSRQPRFGGQTAYWWSVLDHTLFCDEALQAGLNGVNRDMRVALLLHDAHEALTGDVPTPLKTPDFKAMQDQLDERIYGAYLPDGYRYPKVVKMVDRHAMLAEARALLPHAPDVVNEYFEPPRPWAEQALLDYLERSYARYSPDDRLPGDIPGVREFLRRMDELGVGD